MTKHGRQRPERARTSPFRRLRTVTAVLAVGAALVACADAPPDRSVDVSELQLSVLPRIGGEVGPAQGGFGKVADLELGENGFVFVLDQMARTVRVFDESGAHVRTFGRRGRGPGELERPTDLAWGPDGNLWVVDPGNGRYTVFDPNGDLVDTYRHSGSGAVFHFWAVGFSAAGRFYFVTSGPDPMKQDFWLVECEVGDGEVREARRLELPFVEQPTGFEHTAGGMVIVVQVPFSSTPVFRIGADGRLWYAETRQPWIHRWSPSDSLERAAGREFDPPRVTEAELRDALERESIDELRRAGGADVFAEFASLIPDTKPHLEGFVFDDEGNVWVIRTGRADGDTRAMDVYDPSGALLATAHAPLEPDPRPRVRDGLIAGVVRDELGIESIARYRIRR